MNVTAVHLWTQSNDEVYAAALDGETVLCAIEVDAVDPMLLDDQVEQAILERDLGNVGLAEWLTEELAYGRALIVGHYFELGVSL